MARKVTLSDISQIVGVGVATVSRALAGHPDVSRATSERVHATAKELGYRPSVAARALRNGGYRALSVILPDAAWGWWEPVVRAAFHAAAEEGYQLLVHPVAGVSGGAAAVVRGLANVPTEGVIVVSVPDQKGVRAACDEVALPTIAIDDTSHELRFPTVSVQNRDGARAAVAHLIAKGHRSIAMVTADFSVEDTGNWGEGLFVEERLAGYREALEDAGIPFDPALVIPCEHAFDESPREWPELRQALDEGLEIDGVFCLADQMSVATMRTLRAYGVRIPEDVSVVGFDDERLALMLDPPLTTMRQPYAALGLRAVKLLLRAIEGEDLESVRHEIPAELVERSSVLLRE